MLMTAIMMAMKTISSTPIFGLMIPWEASIISEVVQMGGRKCSEGDADVVGTTRRSRKWEDVGGSSREFSVSIEILMAISGEG